MTESGERKRVKVTQSEKVTESGERKRVKVTQSEKVTESGESERNKSRVVERSIMMLLSPSPV